MTRNNSATQDTPLVETLKRAVRANVSFDLTAEELESLIELCADNGLFRLGIRLAERKSRLLSNLSRMRKDLEALEIGAEA